MSLTQCLVHVNKTHEYLVAGKLFVYLLFLCESALMFIGYFKAFLDILFGFNFSHFYRYKNNLRISDIILPLSLS